jgi:hypothetical protein
MATVNALSTANAPDEGTIVAPGQVETAVAGTLTAMVTESEVPDEPGLVLPYSGTGPSPEASPSETSTWTTVPPAAPSNTPIPTNTPNPGVTSTSTSFVPNTPTQTQAPTLLVSSTATWTTTPTIFVSSTPTHTNTTEPTTIPAASDPCDVITLGGFSPKDKIVVVEVTKSSGSDIFITYIEIYWPDGPDGNGELKKVKVGKDTIMDDEDDDSPSEVTCPAGTKKCKIRNGPSEDLNFEFSKNAAPAPYSLEVTFDNSCTIIINN